MASHPPLARSLKKLFPWKNGDIVGVYKPEGLVGPGGHPLCHPAVVLNETRTDAYLISGSTKRRHGRCLPIYDKTPEFEAIGVLEQTTYFHDDSVWVVELQEVKRWRPGHPGKVTVAQLDEMREFAQELVLRKMAERVAERAEREAEAQNTRPSLLLVGGQGSSGGSPKGK